MVRIILFLIVILVIVAPYAEAQEISDLNTYLDPGEVHWVWCDGRIGVRELEGFGAEIHCFPRIYKTYFPVFFGAESE